MAKTSTWKTGLFSKLQGGEGCYRTWVKKKKKGSYNIKMLA